jgi:dihydrofolate reductase
MINAIFAADEYGGMGVNGTLPWPHNSDDLKRFKDLTTGHVVVMGRRTWDDPKMPKPLPNRITYVATNRFVPHASPIRGDIAQCLLDLETKHPDKTIWVIGGVGILEEARPVLDRVYLTHFKSSFKVDTKIHLKNFLTGFIPVRAEVNGDFKSTLVIYENFFKRTTTDS